MYYYNGCTKVSAVLTGRSTVSGFDLAWFSSLSSAHLCVFGLRDAIYMLKNVCLYPCLHFSELSLVGLALDVVD